jgi:hypothetical protein
MVPAFLGCLSLGLAGCAGDDPGCVVGLTLVFLPLSILSGGALSPHGDPCKRTSAASPTDTATAPAYVQSTSHDRQLAEGGDAHAQYSLGVDYNDGLGVQANYAEAARWFRRASDQGYAIAQRSLGEAYELGQGVQQDYVESDKWYILAVAGGEESAAGYRSSPEKKMTPVQIGEAQKRASAWKPVSEATSATPGTSAATNGQSTSASIAGVSPSVAPASSGQHPRMRGAVDGLLAAQSEGIVTVVLPQRS